MITLNFPRHKPVEEDIITFPHIEIKYLTTELIPHDKKLHKTRILTTQQQKDA